MEEGISWIDEIVESSSYDWERIGPSYANAMLRPGVPCRITAGSSGDGKPVLYVSVGVNGTVYYWQWATLDQKTSRALPREKAIGNLWRFIDMALLATESEAVGALAG